MPSSPSTRRAQAGMPLEIIAKVKQLVAAAVSEDKRIRAVPCPYDPETVKRLKASWPEDKIEQIHAKKLWEWEISQGYLSREVIKALIDIRESKCGISGAKMLATELSIQVLLADENHSRAEREVRFIKHTLAVMDYQLGNYNYVPFKDPRRAQLRELAEFTDFETATNELRHEDYTGKVCLPIDPEEKDLEVND